MKPATLKSSWIIRPKPNSKARIRLFCFPYAGGNAALFHNWPMKLPGFVDVCSVQLPGRGTRLNEPAFTNLKPLIDELFLALRPFLDLPFVLVGHSLGGLIGFELTRLLRREHIELPLHLIVSGRSAPHLPDVFPRVGGLSDDEFIVELRRLNGTPAEIFQHKDLLDLVLPVLRADFTVCETYEYFPEPPLGCPITVFGGTQDAYTTRSSLEAWKEYTDSVFQLQMFLGDHFFLHSAQSIFIQELTKILLLEDGSL